jgi:peptide/nickel transport system substrate-binding protein
MATAGIATAVSAATSTSSYSANYTLVASLQSEPTNLQPDAEVNDAAYDIDQNIYNKLVTLNTHYGVVPDLAYKWSVSSNGLTYTFFLHHNVTWSDGVPFTSADVVWTLEHIVNDHGNAAATLPIKTVTADGKYIVKVTLQHRDAAFLGFLGWYGTFILPEHIYKGTNWLTNPNNEAPVGTGPFIFQSWKKGQSITLVANKHYFLGAPKVAKLVFTFIPDAATAVQALLTGETDIDLDTVPDTELPTLKANPKISTTMISYPDFAYIDPNVRHTPMSNLQFRLAMAYAINRQQISQKATEGIWPVAQGMYPPVIAWAHDPNVHLPPYDPQKAKQLLTQAGFKPNAHGVRASVNLVYFNIDPFPNIALLIKDDLAQVGIQVSLVELDISTWTTRVSVDHNFDLALLSGFQGPDPAALTDRIGPGGAENNGDFNNPEIDRLLVRGEELTNEHQRAQVYFQIQELMRKYMPIIPLTGDNEATIAASYVHNLPWTGKAAYQVTFDNFSLVTVSPH